MITVFADTLEKYRNKCASLRLWFYVWDNGDAYTEVQTEEHAGNTMSGILCINKGNKAVDISAISADEHRVCVLADWGQSSSDHELEQSLPDGRWEAQGFVRRGGRWDKMQVQIIPLQEDLFSRARGLFDSGVLSNACVFVAGLGSVGSFVAEELAKSGVMNFILLDNERYTVGNVARSSARILDVGRRKTKVVEEQIHQKNCYARTETYDVKLIWRPREVELARRLVRRSDIVIGSVDNRDPRVILNRLCVEENKRLILMGALHRAYGGQVLFVKKPGPCYQCFLMTLPADSDHGVSDLGQGRHIPYADHPVDNLEPGLSIDIAPISIMCLKLCINELLKGKPTTMRSLDEDLIAPWYIYLNRREGPYEELKPLGFNVGDGMHILAWYGIDLKPNPGCPVCGGNHINEMSRNYGV